MLKHIFTYFIFLLITYPLYGYTLETVTVNAQRCDVTVTICEDEGGTDNLDQNNSFNFDHSGVIGKDNGRENLSASRITYHKISFHTQNQNHKDKSLFISKNSITFQLHKRYILLDNYLEFKTLLI